MIEADGIGPDVFDAAQVADCDAPLLDGAAVRLRVDGIDSMPFKYDEASRGFVFDDQQRITIT